MTKGSLGGVNCLSNAWKVYSKPGARQYILINSRRQAGVRGIAAIFVFISPAQLIFDRGRSYHRSDGPYLNFQAGIDGERDCNTIKREERKKMVELLKGLQVTVVDTRPVAEAIVTAGGVDVKEVNPRTMESRLVQGLFFAGEVLDIDGYTGGFNLQAAFSTGFAAGKYAARKGESPP